MTNETIRDVLEKPEYQFLKTGDRLGSHLILLTFGGSKLYGTNTPTSDTDIRGVTLEKASDIIGFSNFEQRIDNDIDTVIYGFNKFIKLCLDNNPNVLELLAPRENDYIASGIGHRLLDMQHDFLSKRCARSFGGYAHQQLRRLENALCHDRYNEADRQRHLFNTLHDNIQHLQERYSVTDYGTFDIVDDDEIRVHMCVDGMPLNDMRSLFSEMNEIVKTYNKLNGRNHKKDDLHLNKHAMHLIRLFLTAIDIFEKEEIIAYRKDDIPLLMSIRNGEFQNEDSTYKPEFFEMVDEYEKRFNYACENTSLPDVPNIKKVEEFVMNINRCIVEWRM